MKLFHSKVEVILFALILLSTPNLLAQSQSEIKWLWTEKKELQLPKGIQVFETNSPLPDNSPNHAVYAILDRNENPNLDLKALCRNGILETPLKCYQENQSVREKAHLVINGGYFGKTSSVSLVYNNGQRLSPSNYVSTRTNANGEKQFTYPSRAAFGIEKDGQLTTTWTYDLEDENGKLSTFSFPQPIPNNELKGQFSEKPSIENIDKNAEKWQPIFAIGAGPILVQNGKIHVTYSEELFGDASGVGAEIRHPRTAIGHTTDGKIIMLVVDGRQAGYATGLSLHELASVMKELGAINAINLDGGGSSVMIADGKTISSPSDNSGQRPVSSVVMICTRSHVFDHQNEEVFNSNCYTLTKDFVPAEYQLDVFTSSTKKTPISIKRKAMETLKFLLPQKNDSVGFHTVGKIHLSARDQIFVHDSSNTIRLTKTAESKPTLAILENKKENYLKDDLLKLQLSFDSPNTGVHAKSMRVFQQFNNGIEKQISTTNLNEQKVIIPFKHKLNKVGKYHFRFEFEDNLGGKNSISHHVISRNFELSLNHSFGKHQTQSEIQLPLKISTAKLKNEDLHEIEIFRITNGDSTLIQRPIFSSSLEIYLFKDKIDAKATEVVRYLFRAITSKQTVEEIQYTAEIIPARGSTRLAVISDLNSNYGATSYEWQVDSIMQRIPRIWQPDMVVCGGDMIAGQSNTLTETHVQKMWKNFDEKVFSPLKDAQIPFAFTLGNHDGTQGFDMEQAQAEAYWKKEGNHPNYETINGERYPFFTTFRIPNNPDIFFLSWDASKPSFTEDEIRWIEDQLKSKEAQQAKMRFVIGHLPLYAVSSERNSHGNTLAEPDKISALLQKYKVHSYISGHHHAYYPAKRGCLELLNTGAIGSGARPWIDSSLQPTNTVTLMDIFLKDDPHNLYGKDTVVYTTYETHKQLAEQMTILEEKALPESIISYNGYLIRKDIPLFHEASAILSPKNMNSNVASEAKGEVQIHLHGKQLEIEGTFQNLSGKLLKEQNAAAIYFGAHGDEAQKIVSNLNVNSSDQQNGTIRALITENIHDIIEQMNTGIVYVLLKFATVHK